jgi:hypothetical protein
MSKDYSCATDRVIISAQTRFFGEATATIEATGEREAWQSRRLSKIHVEYRSGLLSTKRLELPAKALEDAGRIYMNRWEFRDEGPSRGLPKSLYLVGVAPFELTEENWVDKVIHFVIEDGVFKRLSWEYPIGEGSWQHGGIGYV